MRFARFSVAFAALLLSVVPFKVGGAELTGIEAPDFALKSVAGSNLRLSEYRGQVVLVSFWASWCGDCRSQLRSLSDMYRRYAGAGFELLAVSLDSDLRQVTETVDALKPEFPVLHDLGGDVGEQYDVQKMPFVVLIDRDGVVREEFEGYRRGEEDQYLERVRALLNE